MSHDTLARDHMIKFPLRTVGVIWIGAFPRRDAANLHIERMPFPQVRGPRLASQCFGDFFSRAHELSFWGRPGQLIHILRINFSHTLLALPRIEPRLSARL